jgi:predicted alpha-1,6-mannanase (GH76 family)
LQIITSDDIYKKKEQMIDTDKTIPTTYNNPIVENEEDYGQYYDTEFDKFYNEKPVTEDLDTYDDAYEEYLDRYENAMNYEDFQLNLIYKKERSIFDKIMEKGLILYIIQYVYNLCNFNN